MDHFEKVTNTKNLQAEEKIRFVYYLGDLDRIKTYRWTITEHYRFSKQVKLSIWYGCNSSYPKISK